MLFYCSCDEYSNCLPGNPKVIKNCTIFSGTVCQGCAEGSYFEPDVGMNGGCIECSPPCGLFEKEVRSCTTEHDRLCSKHWTEKEILVPSLSRFQLPNSTTLDSTEFVDFLCNCNLLFIFYLVCFLNWPLSFDSNHVQYFGVKQPLAYTTFGDSNKVTLYL